MDNYLQMLPMDIINYIKNSTPQKVYYVYSEYGEWSDYNYDFIGIYSTEQKAIEAIINLAVDCNLFLNADVCINTYIKHYTIDADEWQVYTLFNLPNKPVLFSLEEDQLILEYQNKMYKSCKRHRILNDIKEALNQHNNINKK